MNILITGGTGFLGAALARSLYDQNCRVTVLTRHPQNISLLRRAGIQALGDLQQLGPTSSFHAIINLAGEPLFAGRWTPQRKAQFRDSRIGLTGHLVAAIARMQVKPRVLISGSAIGYYGNQGDTPLSEYSAVHEDFSQQLCHDWELAARQAEALGVRVCLLRTGLVLAQDGGLLGRMLPVFRAGLGGRLGDGQQWMSWIHRQDWLAIVQTLLNDDTLHGPYNATAPHPVTNGEFTRTLAAGLHRPALLPLPGWLLKPLLGEMSELLLGSQKVLPQRLLESGYIFQYSYLDDALGQALARN